MDRVIRQRRKKRIKSRIHGTAVRPRASIFRSLRHISIQLIDDETGRTLLTASSVGIKKAGSNKTETCRLIGQEIAVKAKNLGIAKIVFDRNGFKYHGRIKAAAEAMRDGGLKF